MRLDDVSSDDVASVSFDGVEVFVSMFTETSGGAQPARVIANPAASNTVANRFMSIILLGKRYLNLPIVM